MIVFGSTMAYWDGPSGYWFHATCACGKFTAKPKFRCETPVLGAEHLEEFHWSMMLHIHNADLYYGKIVADTLATPNGPMNRSHATVLVTANAWTGNMVSSRSLKTIAWTKG